MNLQAFKSLLEYAPATGAFKWKVSRGTAKAGDRAGRDSGNGYFRVQIDGSDISLHRLAWLFVHGQWPLGIIDHINGNPSDNRIANLRLATQSLNNANARIRSNNTSGCKGVSWSTRRGKWLAQIKVNRKSLFLGYHETREQAQAAYMNAARTHFGEFARAADLAREEAEAD